jgi:hypothetical protein
MTFVLSNGRILEVISYVTVMTLQTIGNVKIVQTEPSRIQFKAFLTIPPGHQLHGKPCYEIAVTFRYFRGSLTYNGPAPENPQRWKIGFDTDQEDGWTKDKIIEELENISNQLELVGEY